MKIKETKTCGAFAWSPTQQYSGLMAIGSIAGAMSEDFNSDAHLEIRGVDVWDTNTTEMPVLGRITIPDPVHRLAWSSHGGGRGILAGGFTDGTVGVWSADKIVEAGVATGDEPHGEETALLCKISAHTSAAKGCHFNPLAPELLATGGGDKEMKIYSLDASSQPKEVQAMGPNKTATHTGEITDLRWNPRFKHILGTTTSNGQLSCWDLKSKKMTMQINVSPQGAPCSANTLSWHPDVATQVAVARDDPQPVIQVWDLRKATAPIRELKGHSKGVLSLAWCAEDASVLMSTGADGRTMCWNPLTGDLFGEMPPQDNWVYDCSWAPHTPAVICTASFDNSLSIFGAQDISSAGSGGAAPKWLSRPCSASFGFGGRIAVPGKGTNGKTIKIIKTPASDDSTAAKERQFCAQINSTPVNSAEGVDWINARGWGEIAAAAATRVSQSKTPMMKFLGADAEAVERKVEDLTNADDYSQDDADFNETVAECVTAGKLVAAIDLCMVAGKFDDAFGVAYVAGDDQMKRVHAEFVAKKSGKHRFAKYLGSIASGDFESLIEVADTLPWREVLSLYAAFAPKEDFTAHCNKLGDSLYAAGELQPAVTCYVFGSNVDQVAALQKESGSFDAQNLVQLLTVLEQSVGRQCTNQAFAAALASYAETLAFDGEFQSAAHYAQRAAQLGCKEAALVAHRVQTHVGQRAEPPFQVTPLPDATAMDCQMLAAKQAQVITQQQPVVQAPAPTTRPTVAATSNVPATRAHGGNVGPSASHVDPRAQVPTHSTTAPAAGQNLGQTGGAVKRMSPIQPSGGQFGGQPGMVTGGTGGHPGGQPHATVAPVAPVAHGQHNAMHPPANTNVGQPTGGAGHPAALGQNTAGQPHGGTQPPVSAAYTAGQPPVTRPPVNTPPVNTPPVNTPPVNTPPVNTPPVSTPPVNTPPVNTPPVNAPPMNTPPVTTPPAVVTPTTAMPPTQPVLRHSPVGVAPSAGSMSMGSTAAGKETAADQDVSNVAPEYQQVVAVVQARVEKIADKRRRDTTEKAAIALIKQLNANAVAPALGQLLIAYAAALGANQAAGAKEQWKIITEKHWDAIQPFHNIKFL